MQTFAARKDRVEMEFSNRARVRWLLIGRAKQRGIVHAVACTVGQRDTIERAEDEARAIIRHEYGMDPIVMWLIGQVLSAVIKAIWEWAHSDE